MKNATINWVINQETPLYVKFHSMLKKDNNTSYSQNPLIRQGLSRDNMSDKRESQDIESVTDQ